MDRFLRPPGASLRLACGWLAAVLVAPSLAWGAGPASGPAATVNAQVSTQVRDFAILVDGKRSGDYRMTVDRYPDGAVIMQGQADVRVRFFIFDYAYSYRGRETWRQDRLVGLESRSDDGGQRYQVSAAPEGNLLRVTVNGQPVSRSLHAWTTSFWRLPHAARLEGTLPVLDVDNGNEVEGKLQLIEAARIAIGNQTRSCQHYRLSGGTQTELWFDDEQLLVRQETVEEGHKTVLSITRIAQAPAQQAARR